MRFVQGESIGEWERQVRCSCGAREVWVRQPIEMDAVRIPVCTRSCWHLSRGESVPADMPKYAYWIIERQNLTDRSASAGFAVRRSALPGTARVADEPEPHPKPVQRAVALSEPLSDTRTCNAVRSTLRAALRAGWETGTYYAKGVGLDQWGKPRCYDRSERKGELRYTESVIVRLRRGDEHLVAVWWDGKFESAYGAGGRLSAKELKERIKL